MRPAHNRNGSLIFRPIVTRVVQCLKQNQKKTRTGRETIPKATFHTHATRYVALHWCTLNIRFSGPFVPSSSCTITRWKPKDGPAGSGNKCRKLAWHERHRHSTSLLWRFFPLHLIFSTLPKVLLKVLPSKLRYRTRSEPTATSLQCLSARQSRAHLALSRQA